LRQWQGSVLATLNPSGLVAQLTPDYFLDPTLLASAAPVGNVLVTAVGNQLTIDPPVGFSGKLLIEASVFDGFATVIDTFWVTIQNLAPTLNPILAQQLPHTQDSITIGLFGNDPDGDPLTYEAQISPTMNVAARLQEQFRFTWTGGVNNYGLNEKWLQSTVNGGYYALMPAGTIHQWMGSIAATINSGLVGTLTPVYHDDPTLITTPSPIAALTRAFELDQALNFEYVGAENAYGGGEKWFRANNGSYYAIFANGELRQWKGSLPATLGANGLVAALDAAFHTDPLRLVDVALPTGIVQVNGDQLTIDPPDGMLGKLVIEAAATDGIARDVRTFVTSVVNALPTMPAIADQVMGAGQASLSVNLGAGDPDGDTLQFSAQVSASMAVAHQLSGFRFQYVAGADNSYGAGEKWLYSPVNGYYYALIKNGGRTEVRQWMGTLANTLGSRALIATLDGAFYDDPALLTSVIGPPPSLTFSFAGGQLTVQRPAGFTGDVLIDVFVSDGAATVKRTFRLRVL
jgi:hypothetical protein